MLDVEEREGHGAREHRDEGCGAGEPAPFALERELLGLPVAPVQVPLPRGHGHQSIAEKPFVQIKGRAVGTGPPGGRCAGIGCRMRRGSRYGAPPVREPMRRLPRVLPTAALAITLMAFAALAPAAGAQAPQLTRCPGQAAFGCGTLNVPLDYSGAVPGTIPLRFAARRTFPRTGKILFALTGGPGQQGIDFATPSALSLAPALRQYRLVTVDQRGTGKSGVLRCPRCRRRARSTSSCPTSSPAARAASGRGGSSTRARTRCSTSRASARRSAPRRSRSWGSPTGPTSRSSTRAPSRRTSTGSCSTRSSARTAPTRSCSTPTATCRGCCASSARTAAARGATADPVADVAALVTASTRRPAARHVLRRAGRGSGRRTTRPSSSRCC